MAKTVEAAAEPVGAEATPEPAGEAASEPVGAEATPEPVGGGNPGACGSGGNHETCRGEATLETAGGRQP